MKTRRPGNEAEQFEALEEGWRSIPVDLLNRLSDSMPDRIAAVLAAGGYASKY